MVQDEFGQPERVRTWFLPAALDSYRARSHRASSSSPLPGVAVHPALTVIEMRLRSNTRGVAAIEARAL